ncbi:HNH endonuclease [Vreelandella maris]|uniref:HNH endonuclease n=1 Tax=Vreelandella maris TaxID=2729617 RepID=UPI0030EB8C8E
MRIKAIEAERFHEKYIVDEVSGCWIWQAAKRSTGYGAMKVNGIKESAHRVSYTIFKGQIPDGLWVLHKCDNPQCVNPDHLFTGTPLANSQDMHSKGRQRYVGQKGASNPKSILDANKVGEIIKLIAKGMTNRAIANLFGVSHATISLIRLGKCWADIPRPPDNENFKPYRSLRSQAARQAASSFQEA